MLRKSLLAIMANLCVSGFLGCGNPGQCLADKDCKTCGRCDYGTCRALVCETPDEARCVDDNTLWVFHPKGACTDNECAYGYDEISCAKGCDPQAASCRECNNGCSYVNSTQCQGGKIQTCIVNDQGCLQWGAAADCPTGLCQNEDSCGACENECSLADEPQCTSGQTRSCVADAYGCLTWGSFIDCQDGFCIDANNCGLCDNDCSATGLAQCQDGKIRSCNADGNGCRHWSSFDDCPAGFCQDGESCGSCANQCSPAGIIACHNGQYKRCAADDNGCLIWGNEETCADGFCADDQTCGVCTHHQSFRCYSYDVYWYDSCGTREEMKQDCIADKCTTDSCDPGQCLLDVHCSPNEYCDGTTCEIDPNTSLTPITDGPQNARFPRLSETLLIYQQELPYSQKETRVYDLTHATNLPWTLPFDFNFYYTPLSGNRVLQYYIGPNFTPREFRVWDVPSGGLVGVTTPESPGCSINGYDNCFCDYSTQVSWQALADNTVLLYQPITCVVSGTGYNFGKFSQWDINTQQIQVILEKPLDDHFHPTNNNGIVPYDGGYAIFRNIVTGNDFYLLLDISNREIRDIPMGTIPTSLAHGEILVRKYDSPSNAYRLFVQTLLNLQEIEVTPSGGPGQFDSHVWLGEHYVLASRINEGIENGFYLTDRTTLQERLIARTSASVDNVMEVENDFNGSFASFVQYHQSYYRVVLFSTAKRR